MSKFEGKYEATPELSRIEIEQFLKSSNPCEVADALYSAARYETDWHWVQSECLSRLADSEVAIRWAAATCLGDLAFRRFPIEKELVVPALEAACRDLAIADPALVSLDLVKEFA